MSQLIAFFWTQKLTLWKDRCASAHAPITDKSSARTRQTAQHRMETAYAYGPLRLAIDRRILDIPLEQCLQSRTSDLVAWVKTMFPIISITAFTRLGHNFVPDITSSVIISLTRQRQNQPRMRCPTFRQYRPLPQSVRTTVAYSPSKNDFSMHEHWQLRFHATTFLGAAAPVKSKRI
jgi:hypothetical protein